MKRKLATFEAEKMKQDLIMETLNSHSQEEYPDSRQWRTTIGI